MKNSVYINSISCISAQNTLAENPEFLAIENEQFLSAKEPIYKDFISPSLIRRMSKVVKMSSVAANLALKEAGITNPDAIIVGTGMGCTEDSEKFLRNVIENNEEFLTPTHFIQSTHNTVAGQIALAIQCHAYNFTYVNTASSLEFSLLDAKLQLENNEAKNILVGATDEMAKRTMELYQLNQTIKKKEDLPANYQNSTSKGVVWGEGAAFFVVRSANTEYSYPELIDIEIINHLKINEINDFISSFLIKNNISENDVDVLILGNSGDSESDIFYHQAKENFGNSAQLYFKHLSGEFNTASGFSFFIANQILKKQEIPEVTKLNSVKKENIVYVLIYNNLQGHDHNLMLLKKV